MLDLSLKPGALVDKENLDDLFVNCNERERRFVIGVGQGNSYRAAAMVAGYADTSSDVGGKIARVPHVAAALKAYQALLRAELASIRERLLYSLVEDAFLDIADAYDEQGNLRPIKKIPAHIRQRITAYKPTKFGNSVEFIDRLRAKQLLLTALGIGQHHQGMTININLSPAESEHTREEQQVGSVVIDITPDE